MNDAEFLRSLAGRIAGIDWETDEEYLAVVERVRSLADSAHGKDALEAALREARRNVYRLQMGGERLCEALRKIRDLEDDDPVLMRRIAGKALAHKEPDPDWSKVSTE